MAVGSTSGERQRAEQHVIAWKSVVVHNLTWDLFPFLNPPLFPGSLSLALSLSVSPRPEADTGSVLWAGLSRLSSRDRARDFLPLIYILSPLIA